MCGRDRAGATDALLCFKDSLVDYTVPHNLVCVRACVRVCVCEHFIIYMLAMPLKKN